jgi:N-acetylglucosamine-6-phosphate deacetylase
MPGLDHRAPGPIGVALADPRVTVCLIPDGIHVDPLVVDLAWRLAGPNRLAVVTDAMAALDMPPGRYPLGKQEVIVDGTSARLEDGRLAGSVLGLDEAVRNLRAFTGCSIADAVAAATRTPARLLGAGDRWGNLRAGAIADIALFGPDLTLAATIVGGQLVHAAAGAPRWA